MRKADVERAFPDHVLLNRRDYDRLIEAAEDVTDINALNAAMSADVYLPDEDFGKILAGEHPLRVWRQHKGLTLDQLAEKVGVSRAHLSHMETGRRKGSVGVLSGCAKVLGVTVEDLLP